MSQRCNREACALRLERIAASAKLLAEELRSHIWYDDAQQAAAQIYADAKYVYDQIDGDGAWAAGDR